MTNADAVAPTDPTGAGGRRRPDFSGLDRLGLNLHAILPLSAMDRAWRGKPATRVERGHWRQVVVVGNGGPSLWRTLEQRGITGNDPIDRFSVQAVSDWLASQAPSARSLLLYPAQSGIDLQTLGRLAGWHQPSPLMLGMHPGWGSWFGYRVVMLTETDWVEDVRAAGTSACEGCASRPCVTACPAGAVGTGLDLARCIAHRLSPDSPCATDCLARLVCPAGAEHRYCQAQRKHSYGESLRAIAHWRERAD